MSNARRRAFVAALVGVVGASLGIARAGHVYLREWRCATAWFTFVVGAGLVLLLMFIDSATVTMDSLSREVLFPVLGLLLLSALDAHRVGSRPRGRNANGKPACPVCGGELDRNLDFCPWCTTELEWCTVEG